MNEYEKIQLLVNISKMYYELNFSQQEISNKAGLSRTYISKLLNEARERGIVEIRIHDPVKAETPLEESLRKRYGLNKAIVLPVNDSEPALLDQLGNAAAEYLNMIIREDDIIGVGWGETLHAFSKAVIRREELKNIQVVQLCGGVTKMNQDSYVSDIPRNIARNLSGSCHLIPLPAVLDSVTARNAVMKDRNITEVLHLARQATIAVITVGVFVKENVFVSSGYFRENEIEQLEKAGAVGDICSHIIKEHCEICDPQLEKRTVSVSLEDLISIPTKLCIAAGGRKAKSLKAALTAGCINVFVTNERMAEELLSGN
ncbi:sugar-binding transcriptional regulator [Diplocloster modestus]|uniref:Sugar-binding transcriptional regulator n=1 Tax=Diplocloster modestus TaxID=2850322 RepID=A0ABS6K6A9_9FIRM|nr:sugar-binding transcriptional regulator [Diplocloster modestus]MBU9726081.1 sugar-binding transcriptional regulator [Diplocloster modestus]